MATMVFTYLFWAFIVRTVACCVRKCDQRVAERFQKQTFIENKYESNFYSCVDFRTLLLELDSAFDLKKAIETKFIYKLPQNPVSVIYDVHYALRASLKILAYSDNLL